VGVRRNRVWLWASTNPVPGSGAICNHGLGGKLGLGGGLEGGVLADTGLLLAVSGLVLARGGLLVLAGPGFLTVEDSLDEAKVLRNQDLAVVRGKDSANIELVVLVEFEE
jgi:hypothetical protein